MIANMYVCASHVLSTHKDQRALDPLELELQAVVNLHVGAANEPLTSARAASVLLTKSYLSNPKQLYSHNGTD